MPRACSMMLWLKLRLRCTLLKSLRQHQFNQEHGVYFTTENKRMPFRIIRLMIKPGYLSVGENFFSMLGTVPYIGADASSVIVCKPH